MSAKREKEKRSLLKQLEVVGAQNEDLYEVGYEWFDDDEAHEQWFADACFILLTAPEIPIKSLYPDMLPFLMEELGLISKEDISEILMEIAPGKVEELVQKKP